MSRSKQKGSRIEREIVELMQGLGCKDAERVPMSGMLGGKYKDDVSFTLLHEKLTTEVKARANGEGFAVIEKWLGSADALFLRKDKTKPLVVLPWHVWSWIVWALIGNTNTMQSVPSLVRPPVQMKVKLPKAKKPSEDLIKPEHMSPSTKALAAPKTNKAMLTKAPVASPQKTRGYLGVSVPYVVPAPEPLLEASQRRRMRRV